MLFEGGGGSLEDSKTRSRFGDVDGDGLEGWMGSSLKNVSVSRSGLWALQATNSLNSSQTKTKTAELRCHGIKEERS